MSRNAVENLDTSITGPIFICCQMTCRRWKLKLYLIYFTFHWSYTDVELVMYTFSIINKASVHKLCLVLILCISEFIQNKALLFTTNNRREKMTDELFGYLYRRPKKSGGRDRSRWHKAKDWQIRYINGN